MIFRQILYRDLGCASYFLADGGQAVVVDPRWDIDVYTELAVEEGVRIAHGLHTPPPPTTAPTACPDASVWRPERARAPTPRRSPRGEATRRGRAATSRSRRAMR